MAEIHTYIFCPSFKIFEHSLAFFFLQFLADSITKSIIAGTNSAQSNKE